MNRTLHFDYTSVGHVTVDVMADGTRRPGGTALYAALQAARLGKRAQVITRGVAGEIEALLGPFGDELELVVLPARETTTMATIGTGARRVQRLLAWAGPIGEQLELDTAVLHLAPVARETPARWGGRAAFVGLTPQGLARSWRERGDAIELTPPSEREQALAARTDALALSALERASCAGVIAAANGAGAVVAITDGERPCTLLLAGGETATLAIPELALAVDDLGAGDVFAAALFAELADGRAPLAAAGFAAAAAAVRMSGHGPAAVGERAAIEERYAAAGPAPR